MPRPSRCRRICSEPAYDRFRPEGIPCGGSAVLTVDEYEAIRLIDLEQLTQEECARQMDISRTTAAEVYSAARHKLADSIVERKNASDCGRPLPALRRHRRRGLPRAVPSGRKQESNGNPERSK